MDIFTFPPDPLHDTNALLEDILNRVNCFIIMEEGKGCVPYQTNHIKILTTGKLDNTYQEPQHHQRYDNKDIKKPSNYAING